MDTKQSKELIERMVAIEEALVQQISSGVQFSKNGRQDSALTRVQLRIIRDLRLMDHPTLSALEALLGTSKSSLSITLSKLEKRGYIRVEKDPQDGRIVYWYPTEQGQQEADRLETCLTNRFMEMFQSWDEQTQHHFCQGVSELYLVMQRIEEDRRTKK